MMTRGLPGSREHYTIGETRMETVDLRRDTITLPDDRMRREAFGARLGDSVYGEDPMHEELERRAAECAGMEEGLFLPSGTMGNLVCMLSHTVHGDEIIVEENAHVRTSETGGAGFVGGLMIRTVRGESGAPDPVEVREAIRKDDIHYPRTSLICIETPHHKYGGIVPPLDLFEGIKAVAVEHGLPVHLDGARIFNAALYLGVDVKTITRFADSVMISLSKGLGAPVGSVVCGSRDFMKRARRFRKMLGGGMRQTGWLCACGMVALSEENTARLREDHDNALILARFFAEHPGTAVDLDRVHTNYVVVTVTRQGMNAASFLASMKERGVLASAAGENTVRFVTSKMVKRADVERAVEAARSVLDAG